MEDCWYWDCVSAVTLKSAAGMQEAASLASKGAPRAEGFKLDLIGSQGAWVAASSLLLGLASGQLVTVNLQADGGTVKRIKVCHRLKPCIQ